MNESVVYCPKCLSFDLMVLRAVDQYDKLVCNNCNWEDLLLSKANAIDMMKKINEKKADVNSTKQPTIGAKMNMDSFEVKSAMQATLCYDSIETCGPMTLGILRDAVLEAIEKGMPLTSEVFNSGSEEAIEGIRFLYETDKVEKIDCGEHSDSFPHDILISTHECEVDDEAHTD